MKKKSAHVLALLLGLVLVAGACGSNNNANTSGGTPSENAGASSQATNDNGEAGDPVSNNAAAKITIFQSKVEITDQMHRLAREYQEETGVEVEVWETTGDGYLSVLRTRLTNPETAPTIFSVGGISEAKQLSAYLHDMSNAPFVGNIAENLELVVDGQIVGLPYGIEGFGVVYNKNLISAGDMTDLESFTNTLRRFQEEGIRGFSLSSESFFLIAHILNTPFGLQADPEGFIEALNAGEVTMAETAEFREWAAFMEVIREYNPTPLDQSYDLQTGNFATGRAASIHQGNWAWGMFADFDMDFEMGMKALPIGGNDKITALVPSYWVVNSQADASEIQAAMDFIDWLVSSERGQAYIVDDFGFIPAMTNITANDLDPLSRDVLAAANAGKTIPGTFGSWPAGIVDVHLAPVAEEFFINTSMTGQAFLERLDEAWQAAVTER